MQRLDTGGFNHASGFVLQIKKKWYWVTAGHAIEEFKRHYKTHGSIEFFFRVPLDDQGPVHIQIEDSPALSFRSYARAMEAIFSPLEDWQKELNEHLRSADVGIVEIPEGVREALHSVGTRPFTRKHVRIYENHEIEGGVQNETFLFGLPGASMRREVDNAVGYFKALQVDYVPDSDDALRAFFTPDWDTADHEGSVRGMSGGPIVLLGWKRPVVLAVQSEELVMVAETDALLDSETPTTLMTFQVSKLYETIIPEIAKMWSRGINLNIEPPD